MRSRARGGPGRDAGASEQTASWPAGRRSAGLRLRPPGGSASASALASARVVLLVGFGVGVCWQAGTSSCHDADRLPTPTASRRRRQAAAAPPEAAAEPPQEAPPPIDEIVRLQPPPVPPAATAKPPGDGQRGASAAEPAPRSSRAGEGRSTTAPIDAAVSALGRGRRLRRPVEPVVEASATRRGAGSTCTLPRAPQGVRRRPASGPAPRGAGFCGRSAGSRRPDRSASIRYFFAADRDAAEALSASLKGEIPGGDAPPIMDFTHFEPKPQPGNLEIWVVLR